MTRTAQNRTTAPSKPLTWGLVALACLLAFLLVGCTGNGGGKNEAPAGALSVSEGGDHASFVKRGNGLEVRYTYYFDKESRQITAQTIETVRPFDVIPADGKEAAQQALEPLLESTDGVKGLTHTIEYGESVATETLAIDFGEAEPTAISKHAGLTILGNHGKASLDGSIAYLTSNGFSAVE